MIHKFLTGRAPCGCCKEVRVLAIYGRRISGMTPEDVNWHTQGLRVAVESGKEICLPQVCDECASNNQS